MQVESNRNLSRKFRPSQFEQLVGQDLAVKMLKNSLYLDHCFPVYLFSGQRGCGKTTTARIFAAAINCAHMAQFQKTPTKITVPCLQCASCSAMQQGRHPDFVEVDAASHTGVDNVRELLESSVLLPIMGKKKVYLIDEVHMLSKAACNALLKMLEEPPSSALFLLATTDPQKLPDTVRSRCFQLFFGSIPTPILSDYLATICDKEEIAYEKEGLQRVVEESGGCVRDALNLLEQVRFSHGTIQVAGVVAVLGYIADEHLYRLIQVVSQGDVGALLDYITSIRLASFSTEYTWRRLVELVRAALWVKHGVTPPHISVTQLMEQVAVDVSFEFLHELLEQLYVQYDSFMRTTAQYVWFETLLLRLCRINISHNPVESQKKEPVVKQIKKQHDTVTTTAFQKTTRPAVTNNNQSEKVTTDISLQKKWALFVDMIDALQEQLVASLFRQAVCTACDAKTVTVILPADRLFFKDVIQTSTALWQPKLQEIFGAQVSLTYLFEGESGAHTQEKKATKVAQEVATKQIKEPLVTQKKQPSPSSESIDLTDLVVAPMILQHFPGVVSEVLEDDHGVS